VKRKLAFHPLTPERWPDLEQLFGPRGACGGCWCMVWRLTRSRFEQQKGSRNKEAMKRIVAAGEVPGIIAYAEGVPIGWCAVAPRDAYPVLARSRVLKPIDEESVWSISCFFVRREHRHRGVTVELLKAAVKHVRKHGGSIVEGYPVEPKRDEMPPVFAWTGLPSAFLQAGFVECARRSPTRPIMRRVLRR
jgi:GNAT superfamily N-acetyltransferase